MQKIWVWFLGLEDPLEKEMATHFSMNSKDRGAWGTIVHRIANSWRRLGDWAHNTHSEMITVIRLVNTLITHGLLFFCVVRIFKIYSLDFSGDPVVKTPGSQCSEPEVQFLFKELRSCMLLGSAKKQINTRSYKIFGLSNLQVDDSVLLILVIMLCIRFPRIYLSYNWKFVSFDHHHPFPTLWWPPIYFLIL